MKKISTTVCAFLALQAGMVFGQSQRLVLYEEFTGENCGPCAATNPGLNTLLAANTSKIRAIKYQTAIPTAPPAGSLYSQTTSEMDARRIYYSVPFAPYGRHDGLVVTDPTGGTLAGHPGYFTQTTINTEYAATSPFTMNLSHSYTTNYDSINVRCIVNCTQAYSYSGTFKLHVVMTEEEIHLPAPIGNNGEKDFEDVMRKMIPDANGTTVAASWLLNAADTFDFKVKIPSYIYDYNQIAFVAFLQEDGSKYVQQTGYSAPIVMPTDASVKPAALDHVCSSTITPDVLLENKGSTTLTSVDFSYKVDNGTPAVYTWTGSIAAGITATVTLPAISVPVSTTHTLSVSTAASVNGGSAMDHNSPNNTNVSTTFYGSTSTLPNEAFNPYNSPDLPAGWIVENPDNDYTWQKTYNTANNGYARIRNFQNVINGAVDHFYGPMVNLSSLTGTYFLNFDYAYCQLNGTENDKLEVFISTDCGQNWTSAFSKQGSTLATSSPDAAYHTPVQSDFRKQSIDLTSYVGQTNVLYRFTFTSNLGNNMSVDNINISTTATGIKGNAESTNSSFSVYPNPFSNKANVIFDLNQTEKVKLVLQNSLGEVVYSEDYGSLNSGKHSLEINRDNLSSGIYFITVTTDSGSTTNKVSINK